MKFSRNATEGAFAAREVIAGKGARTSANESLVTSTEEFSAAFRNSPGKRAKLAGLQRNAAVVLGNTYSRDDVPALTEALNDPEPLVREHAAWALANCDS